MQRLNAILRGLFRRDCWKLSDGVCCRSVAHCGSLTHSYRLQAIIGSQAVSDFIHSRL